MATYVRGSRSFRLSATPAAESRLWAAQGIAGDLSPWDHVIGSTNYDRRRLESQRPLSNWHATCDAEGYFDGLRSLADVGIVWSAANLHHYAAPRSRTRFDLPFYGWCRALQRARRPFRPIEVRDIPDALRDGRLMVLVLPHLAALSDDDECALLAWLDAGRDLVISGALALLDGEGRPRSSSRLRALLGLDIEPQRLLGVDLASGDPVSWLGEGTSEHPDDWEQPAAHSYLRLPAKLERRHAMLEGFEETTILAAGERPLPWSFAASYETVASAIPAFPIYPPEFSWMRPAREPEAPAIAVRRLASGARVVVHAVALDRAYAEHGLPDHGQLLAASLPTSSAVEVSGPGACTVALYAQVNGRVQLHLVANPDAGSAYIEAMPSIGPYRIRLASTLVESLGSDTAGGKAWSARLLVSGGEVPALIDAQSGELSFELPTIELHERVLLTPRS